MTSTNRKEQAAFAAHQNPAHRWKKTLLVLSFGLAAGVAFVTPPALAQTANVLKSHNDLANTGQNLQETTLTPALLRSGRFDLLFRIPIDTNVGPEVPHNLSGSQIYAQPLYLAGLPLPEATGTNTKPLRSDANGIGGIPVAFAACICGKLWKNTATN